MLTKAEKTKKYQHLQKLVNVPTNRLTHTAHQSGVTISSQ